MKCPHCVVRPEGRFWLGFPRFDATDEVAVGCDWESLGSHSRYLPRFDDSDQDGQGLLARALRLLLPHSAALERFDKLRFTMQNVQNGKYKACNKMEYDKLSKHFIELVKALVHTNDHSNDHFKRIGKKLLMHEWKCVL